MSVQYVKIHHGLCTSFHSIEHKPQLVKGLQDRLHKLGFRVDLFKVPYINYCMVEVCGHEVFRCNILNLRFSMHYARDIVAQRAIAAVQAASEKLKIARNHLWVRNMVNDEIFTRGPYAPVDTWPLDVEVKPYTTCNQCVACCDITVSKRALTEKTASKCYEFNVCSDFELRYSRDVGNY